MGVNEDAFSIAWDAIMLVASIPTIFLATRARWQYRGKPDRLRTAALLSTTVFFLLDYIFDLAENAYLTSPITGSVVTYERTTIGLGLVAEIFQLCQLLSTAFVFFRTAIALLYGMSGGQKLGLIRVIELAGSVGYALLVVLAGAVWGVLIWYQALVKRWVQSIENNEVNYDQGPAFDTLQNSFLIEAKIAVAYEWIYFVFVVIFLPIVFLQVFGRRTDRVAILLFTASIMLVAALHVVQVVNNLVAIHKRDLLDERSTDLDKGLTIAVLIVNSLFELIAIYFLAFMGMRDPKRLTGDDGPVFMPVAQRPHGDENERRESKYELQHEMGSPQATELPTAGQGYYNHGKLALAELSDENAVNAELPGDGIAPPEKSASKKLGISKRG